MKRAVRVVSEYAGDPENAPDQAYKIVFDAVIDEAGKLPGNRFFGFVSDDGEVYPFVLEPPTGDTRGGRFNWGHETSSYSAVNIFERVIAVNELFTRTEPEYGEWPYRIVKVLDLAA
jgi:hypothetical protein